MTTDERVHLRWGTVHVTDDPENSGRLRVSGASLLGTEFSVGNILPLDLVSWLHGTLIQKAMPYVDWRDREVLITGVTVEENVFQPGVCGPYDGTGEEDPGVGL